MRPILFAALLAALPVALPAQAPSDALRAMLSALPDPTGLPRLSVTFGDPGLARGLDLSGVDGASNDPGMRSMRGVPPMAMGMALMPLRDRAATAAGFGVTDIARVLHLSAIPQQATILDLVPGGGAAVAPALAAMGYAEQTERGVTAWAMGEEGRRGTRAARNRDDPFRQLAGLPRVVIDGDRLRHAEGWDMALALLRGVGGSILARADIAALVAALDSVTDAGALVAAVLYPDMTGVTRASPAQVVPGLPATAAWRSMLLADLTDGPQSTGMLALAVTLPNAASAQALADRMVRAWDTMPISPRNARTLADTTGGPVAARVHPAGDGLWVVILRQTRPTVVDRHGNTRNATFDAILSSMRAGPLPLLQP